MIALRSQNNFETRTRPVLDKAPDVTHRLAGGGFWEMDRLPEPGVPEDWKGASLISSRKHEPAPTRDCRAEIIAALTDDWQSASEISRTVNLSPHTVGKFMQSVQADRIAEAKYKGRKLAAVYRLKKSTRERIKSALSSDWVSVEQLANATDIGRSVISDRIVKMGRNGEVESKSANDPQYPSKKLYRMMEANHEG